MVKERSEHEEKWIQKQEQKLISKLREQEVAAQRKAQEEKAAADRRSHYMKCPKCGYDLEEIDHEHLKVDRCTHCRGIWLDPGEINELMRRKNWDLLGFFKKKR